MVELVLRFEPLNLGGDHVLGDDVDSMLRRLVESEQLCPALLDADEAQCGS